VCRAELNTATGTGTLSNGVIALTFRGGKWSLAFAGPMLAPTSERPLLVDCTLDAWLDPERRGRLMSIDPRSLGLIHTPDARLVDGTATIGPDGSATLKLTRRFDGFADKIVWIETYTLPPGQPVVHTRTRFENHGTAARYLAYVENGGGLRGRFGPLLRQEPLLKYENPTTPAGMLLSGPSNSFTRIAWRRERCWVGVGSGLGCGIGISTSDNVTRDLLGSTVWALGATGFTTCLIDPEQGNFPYVISPGGAVDTGLSFVATSGGTSIWHQTREFFAATTAGRTSPISSSCSVHFRGEPWQAGEVTQYHATGDISTEPPPALALDFQRAYRLTATAADLPAGGAIQIAARPLGDATASPVPLLTVDRAGAQSIDFTARTGWAGKRQAFVIAIAPSAGARLAQLELAPAPFPAPELSSPADGAALTDLATFFRWKRVTGALDYELQLARDATFSSARTFPVRAEIDWPIFMPADQDLPAPGTWHWRVRAIEPSGPGAWSPSRRMEVNSDRARTPLKFSITPEKPLFTFEAVGVRDFSRFSATFPPDLRPHTAINIGDKFDLLTLLAPLHRAGQQVFVRTHHPSPMTGWTPLADVEAVFQAYPNVMGVMGGESLSAWHHGGAAQTYLERLLKLCGKYGRICYEADGTYPNENKWEAAYASIGPLLRDYAGYLVFAQKNNILHRQFVSQSSTLGLYLSGAITNQGAWEDGGWYWQQVGFRQLGEIRGQRGGVVRDMPRNFWAINFAMGLARGCAIFSLDGQTGTARVPAGHRLAEQGLPAGASPSAYWTSEGELTPAYHRFVAPLLRAILRHQLVPTQAQLREPIRLAVYNDGFRAAPKADPYYYEYHALYAGTYGFRPHGVIPGELMEFFPNTGRYHYIPVLPQGRTDLGGGIELLPLSQLQDPAAVKIRFDAVYPAWYDGDALVNLAGDTLTVLNTNENLDVTERYAVPLPGRGNFQKLAGRIGPHAYVIGKFENRNRRLWLQANTEYPDRDTELMIGFATHPKVTVTPASAARVNRWDPATKTLTLALAHTEGAVEAVVEELEAAYVPITDDPRLPRVLLIGDSVSIAYTLDVRRELAGIANVHRIPANGGSTRTALGPYGLERWLDGPHARWDVIHFNFGLHDLSYRFPDDTDRDAAGNYATPHNGGRPNVAPDRYADNLRAIVARLQQTGAKLIFATTTPVPESDAGKYVRGSEAPYNEAARAVMLAAGVAVNDLWAFAAPRLAELQIPRNVHFHARGSAELAKPVAASIRAALPPSSP
jgi:acyl-CoA thioesterase-1